MLNKFHIGFFEEHVNEFNEFLVVQAANERSNNAKNALTFLSELLSNGNINIKQFEGNWNSLIEEVLPTVLGKTTFHKQFIVNLAKLVTSNASKRVMVPATCNVLMDGARSKIVALCEFSLLALNNFVKTMNPDFFNMGNSAAVNLIRGLGEIMESKKPKLIKCCTPALKELTLKLQSVTLEEALVFCFMPADIPEEETKQNEEELKA